MSNKKCKVAVVGAGSWGTALATVFCDAGASVTLWGRDASVIQGINTRHENTKYLKGKTLPKELKASGDLAETVRDVDVIVCSIPTQRIREIFSPVASLLSSKIIVNSSKGIELGTFARVSEIFAAVVPTCEYVVLSGPSFAEEVVQRLPTAVTVASTSEKAAANVQQLVSTPYFRAYRSKDVIGVELAGALKNVVAIAAGLVAGLKLGYNAQAAIINRGIAEMARVGAKLGANPMTFLGLAGMGDLILTCTGPLSRNRRLGMALAEGKPLDTIQKELGGVAEGVYTAHSAMEFGRKLGVDMPITEQVYKILYEHGTPQKALAELMSRDLKAEW